MNLRAHWRLKTTVGARVFRFSITNASAYGEVLSQILRLRLFVASNDSAMVSLSTQCLFRLLAAQLRVKAMFRHRDVIRSGLERSCLAQSNAKHGLQRRCRACLVNILKFCVSEFEEELFMNRNQEKICREVTMRRVDALDTWKQPVELLCEKLN